MEFHWISTLTAVRLNHHTRDHLLTSYNNRSVLETDSPVRHPDTAAPSAPSPRLHKIVATGAPGELVLAVLAGISPPPSSQPRKKLLTPIEHDSDDLSCPTLLRRYLQAELLKVQLSLGGFGND